MYFIHIYTHTISIYVNGLPDADSIVEDYLETRRRYVRVVSKL